MTAAEIAAPLDLEALKALMTAGLAEVDATTGEVARPLENCPKSAWSDAVFAILDAAPALIEAVVERDALKAKIALAEKALRSVLHLIKPGEDDYPREDMLEGLPDSHPFELTWAAPESRRNPTITAGQLRRMREALSALRAPTQEGVI